MVVTLKGMYSPNINVCWASHNSHDVIKKLA